MYTYRCLVFLLLVQLLVSEVHTAPSSEDTRRTAEYLMKYGYTDANAGTQPDASMVQALTNDQDKMRAALRDFQIMAGLQPTGELTEETLAYIRKPRCGVPDHVPRSLRDMRRRKRFTTLDTAWNVEQIRDIYYKILTVPPYLNRDDVRREVTRAIEMWRSNIPSYFTELQPGQGTAEIEFNFTSRSHGDSFPFDGPMGTLAHAFNPGSGLGGDIHFDPDERWRIRSLNERFVSDGTDVYIVALHELGHALGLGHTNVPGAIMQPFYNRRQQTLGDDDIQGIQSLYGAVRKPPPPPPPPLFTPMPTPTQRPTPTPRPTQRPTPRPTQRPTPRPTQRPTDSPLLPDYCYTPVRFNAIVGDANRRTFAFSDWAVYELYRGGVVAGYPKKTADVFPGHTYGVDAALQLRRPSDNRQVIYLFKNHFVFTYDAYTLRPADPQKRFEVIGSVFRGLPTHLDAIFTWSRNGRVYAFKGDNYYRLDQRMQRVDPNYPRPRSAWGTKLSALDSVFVWPDNSRTYFFSGDNYIRYDDDKLGVDTNTPQPYPRRVASWWLGCPDQAQGLNSNPYRPHHLEGLDEEAQRVRRVMGDEDRGMGWGVPKSTGGQSNSGSTLGMGIWVTECAVVLSLGQIMLR